MPQDETDDPLDIAIVGRSCRLPGAPSVADLWRLLDEGRCAVTTIPADRWSLDRGWHPRLAEPGKTYTWAAGVLDDIWGFDAAAFGISPREAEQMDPQQRLLLELVWEALEDAGIRPSSIAGSETGVFVGASAVDHATLRMIDMTAADAYMMTGNTLSIIANRISYVFDLHGPSFTIDTACSSSLVAVAEAVAALRSGRIDTAIVCGVSLLLAPQSFVGFSQAAMLSRRGLCQAFSADADGYVRAEGGVAIVLKAKAAAIRDGDAIRGFVVAADVNSDGRTNGIALPSKTYQASLLQRIYLDRGVNPDDLAFIEAHGTGTPVGDPIEAAALGEILGRHRDIPLPLGSLKSNIGHLEAASGVAGLLKAMLALEHGKLPRSLHCDTLNPAIDFAGLNLTVAQAPMPLLQQGTRRRLAGVNSFGFGGTNAHVVLAEAPKSIPAIIDRAPTSLILSAHSRDALAALASAYATRFQSAEEPAVVAAATAYKRDRLTHRLVAPLGGGKDLAAALAGFASGDSARATCGAAVARAAPVAFVFSGNGSQFAGMGRAAFARNADFRNRVEAISRAFAERAGWSIVDALQADELAARLARTRVAQPLLFALQSAACHALRGLGLVPDVVLGHSVGEIAAAEAAGILDLDTALDIVFARSQHQELAFGCGGMAVIVGALDAVEAILADIPGLEIAAFNSPRAFTVAGDVASLARLAAVARRHRARVLPLDLAYPFHSAEVAPVQVPLLSDLAGLKRAAGHVPFVSTVSGGITDGATLDAHYWWRNVREPVRFSDAIETAYRIGARVFVEIGPQATLLSHIADNLDDRAASIATIAAMDRREGPGDPLATAAATALVRGARVDDAKIFGSGLRPGAVVALPKYPWQRKQYRLAESADSPGLVRPVVWHPLIGARTGPDRLEWCATLDVISHRWIADHRVDGRVILPGTAFVEMALAVARDWLGTAQARVADLEIACPLVFSGEASIDVVFRISPVKNHLEIASRPRLTTSPWQVHVTAKIVRDPAALPPAHPAPDPSGQDISGAQIYAILERAGLRYGPAFRKVARAMASGTCIRVELTDGEATPAFGLDPARFDACLHALMLAAPGDSVIIGATAYVPVRFDEIILRQPGIPFVSAEIEITRRDARVMMADITMRDRAGEIVGWARGARFQAIRKTRSRSRHVVRARYRLATEPIARRGHAPFALGALRGRIGRPRATQPPTDDFVLLDGWATSFALEIARDLAPDGRLDIAAAVAAGDWPEGLAPWLKDLVGALERSGLAQPHASGHHIDRETMLPSSSDLIAAISRDHPALSAEATAAVAAGLAVAVIRAGGDLDQVRASVSRAVETIEVASVYAQAAAALLGERLRASAWPRDRAMRVLLIGAGPLLGRALDVIGAKQAQLTIFEPERRRHERARLAVEGRGDVTLVKTIEASPPIVFDLVIAAGTLDRFGQLPGFWWALRRAMAPDAIFAAIEPAPSFFRDLLLGLEAHLCGSGARTPGTPRWLATLKTASLSDVAVDPVTTPAGAALMLTGRVASSGRHLVASGTALIVGEPSAGMGATAALATLLASAGLHVAIFDGDEPLDWHDTGEPLSVIVWIASGRRGKTSPGAVILDRCMRLARLAQALGRRAARLWLILPQADATTAAVAAFSRTLANEYAALDIRRIEVAPRYSAGHLAARLRDLVLAESDETDIAIAPDTTQVLRFETEAIEALRAAAPAKAGKLVIGEGAGLDRLKWVAVRRRAPGSGDVEIEVEAIGINFRDVMHGLGLLPDEILEDGFAGPSLGLECAGRVTGVGAGVNGFKPGDRVMAFARDAFATHVTTPAALVAPVPARMSSEAAATIPVAFLTAYYALIEQARLKPNEWVLIHGGAGGVGLAALQIALWRGARVIATAGTPEKRALLRILGAAHVFDSRSGSFVDAVRQIAGDGVAVALNSLAGEPMERTIGLLRPFGRFVELGKRDYVANTSIGLRPFRRNLAYFGVDLDQLLRAEPAVARRLMRNVMRLFAEGKLTPLPHRIFAAAETHEAFRLMQASGHVGKLVLRPPDPAHVEVRPKSGSWHASSDKLHLVTGGLGGFGFATAEWLVARGARDVMLVSRSGAADPVVKEKIAALTAQGVRVRILALDVADGPTLGRLFARFGRDLPPLAGIVHAAMVLDDALIPNLTPAAFARVLAPKVTGATNLDRLTRKLPLDYFLLYSSATTLIGNPGQAAYVAANGFLEGLAQRRRRAGLPALAVAWGAIDDVGVVARAPATRELLATRAGVVAMPSREALDQLGEVLAHADTDPEAAVVTLASMDWPTARAHVPVLRAPAYAGLIGGATQLPDGGKIDIGALVAAKAPDEARKLVGGLIVDEIARVLRLPREDVPRTSGLAEIGLDSLMAVELALGLEARFTLDRPLSATASGFSVNELADHVIGLTRGARAATPMEATLARHLDPEIEAATPAE